MEQIPTGRQSTAYVEPTDTVDKERVACVDTGTNSFEIQLPKDVPQNLLDIFQQQAEVLEANRPPVDPDVAADSKKMKMTPKHQLHNTAAERERFQRVQRDSFRRKVLKLANNWIGYCENSDRLKQTIVVNENKKSRPKKKKRSDNNKGVRNDPTTDIYENKVDELFNQQNGYYYYNILMTNEMEELLSKKRQIQQGETEIEKMVDILAYVADVYLRVMLGKDISPAVFIKFDDDNAPVLFARQANQTPDTCITGLFWTKTIHVDTKVKTSQHVTLQRVRSGRLIQDSTFIMVGVGVLEHSCRVTTENSVLHTRYRRYFKEIYKYVVSIPEIDLSNLGWEVINDAGVQDPIKTFLPKVIDAMDRPADDVLFVNYIDMLVLMIVHTLKMEQRLLVDQQLPQMRVYRTQYKLELAGRKDHPGVYYYRNRHDFITDLIMLDMADAVFDERNRILNKIENDEGVYFYDVQSVREIKVRLETIGISASPSDDNFYMYVLSQCEETKEMISFSKHTIGHKIEEVLHDKKYIRLHETDPARNDTKACSDHMDNIIVKTNLSEYRTTYYFETPPKLTRSIKSLPANLDYGDCVLRSFRIKWKGLDYAGKEIYVMYPIFAAIFKGMSVYNEILPTAHYKMDDDFVFPTTNNLELKNEFVDMNNLMPTPLAPPPTPPAATDPLSSYTGSLPPPPPTPPPATNHEPLSSYTGLPILHVTTYDSLSSVEGNATPHHVSFGDDECSVLTAGFSIPSFNGASSSASSFVSNFLRLGSTEDELEPGPVGPEAVAVYEPIQSARREETRSTPYAPQDRSSFLT